MTDQASIAAAKWNGRHIDIGMREFLGIEGRHRLDACWDRIWVETPATREAFAVLHDCMNAPTDSKPQGLVLVGEADSGKTRTMQAFRDLHKPTIVPEAQFAEHRAIYIGAPDKPSMPIVYSAILDALNHPLFYHRDEVSLRKHTVKMVRGCNVGVIMIDELHDISRQRMSNALLDFLGQMKNFINDTRRPFVVGGVKVITEVLSQDDQIASRFPTVVELKPTRRKDFIEVVADFGRLLPLRRPSFEDDDEVFRILYDRTQGYIGLLSRLLRAACQEAIDTGTESVTRQLLLALPDRSVKAFAKTQRDKARG